MYFFRQTDQLTAESSGNVNRTNYFAAQLLSFELAQRQTPLNRPAQTAGENKSKPSNPETENLETDDIIGINATTTVTVGDNTHIR